MPKPTMSKDKKYRIELRVTFRADIGTLASYLAAAMHHVDDVDRLDNILSGLNSRQIANKIRSEMECRGTDYLDGWADRFGYDETVKRHTIAESHVRRAYPELDRADRESVEPAAPSDTCSVCGKEECANEVCGTEPPAAAAPAACPVHRVKLAPGAVEPKCLRIHGNAEYGVFGDEGSLVNYDCAYEAANHAAEYAAEDPDTEYTVHRVCNEHPDNAADTCEECE